MVCNNNPLLSIFENRKLGDEINRGLMPFLNISSIHTPATNLDRFIIHFFQIRLTNWSPESTSGNMRAFFVIVAPGNKASLIFQKGNITVLNRDTADVTNGFTSSATMILVIPGDQNHMTPILAAILDEICIGRCGSRNSLKRPSNIASCDKHRCDRFQNFRHVEAFASKFQVNVANYLNPHCEVQRGTFVFIQSQEGFLHTLDYTMSIIIIILTVLSVWFIVIICTMLYCRHKDISWGELHNPEFYNTISFPEDALRFRADREVEPLYLAIRDLGYKKMKNSHFVVGGLCRDLGPTKLELFRSRIKLLAQACGKLTVFLFENDSQDNTRDLLIQWQTEEPGDFFLVGCEEERYCRLGEQKPIEHGELSSWRMLKMAGLRNRLLRAIKLYCSQQHIAPDIIMMVDTDLRGTWSRDGIAHSMGHPQAWSVMSANGLYTSTLVAEFHYDLLALRLKDLDDINVHQQGPISVPFMWYKALFTGKRGDPLYPVHSAFGGMTMYRAEVLVKYDYTLISQQEDHIPCEHVVLHDKISRDGHLHFINPSMPLLCGIQSAIYQYPILQ